MIQISEDPNHRFAGRSIAFEFALQMSYYAVRSGKTPGIYQTWDEAKLHTEGFKGAVHKKFKTQSEANDFLQTCGGYSAPTAHYPTSTSSSYAVPSSVPANAYLNARPAPLSRPANSKSQVAMKSSNSADFDYRIYTDGACKGNNHVHSKICPAGWGAVILSNKDEIVDEIYAPVELSPTSSDYMGASVGSNNTAELTAIGEALKWVRDNSENAICACGRKTCVCRQPTISIRYDSEYAAKSVTGTFNGEKNKQLYTNIREIYKSVQSGGVCSDGRYEGQRRKPVNIKFEKVKGHSGDIWNDKADNLANRGASGLTSRSGRYAASPSQKNSEASNKKSRKTVDLCDDGDDASSISKKRKR